MKYCHKYDCKWNIQSVCEGGESCMNDLISRKQAIKLIQKINDEHDSVYATSAIHDVVNGIEQLPSVNPQANRENIHREREQAYMKGYEDASKRYRTEPCDDAISRQDAIRVASGYCHWSNIPDELAKLPSVNPIPCEDAISRQAAIDAMATWDWQELYLPIHFKQLLEDLPSVCTEKTGLWEWVQYDSNPNIGNWHCSECNRIVCGAIAAEIPVYSYKYCPNCGAKMVEPRESENKE